MLMYDGGLFSINRTYWVYMITNLVEQGYIRGIADTKAGNGHYIREQLPGCEITPMGIDYLCGNNLMSRAQKFLKDVKDMTPFI